VSQTFPEASFQSLTGSWWEAASGGAIELGRLVKTIVPYPDLKPYRLVPEGRGTDPRQHSEARYCIEEFRVGESMKEVSHLPVAGMPLRDRETYLVRRGKIRPAVVLATAGVAVTGAASRGGSAWQHKPTLLLAPYYGVDADGTRAGWNPDFVGRIQRVEYPQYVWDLLPVGGLEEGSILRLDHVFPVGSDPANWQLTPYRLRREALDIVHEWLLWHLTGRIVPTGLIELGRTELAKL
jgi:hypothetical protein